MLVRSAAGHCRKADDGALKPVPCRLALAGLEHGREGVQLGLEVLWCWALEEEEEEVSATGEVRETGNVSS